MKSKRPSPKNDSSSESTGMVSAMRLRVLLSSEQARKVSGWIYAAHAFRNAAVAFLTDRRLARARWVKRHPALAKDWIPEAFRGSDANACSQWITVQLEKTRRALALELGLSPRLGKATLAAAEVAAWSRLSRGERDSLRSALLE